MRVQVGAATHVGRAREQNEDGFLSQEPLFAVADGMGGHRAGEVASRMALETLSEVPTDDAAHSLPDRVRAANRVVFQQGIEDASLEGMGTTLTAIEIGPDELLVAHVGDSRAYLLRGNELRLITEDHTLVQRMVREGRLTPDEADVHPQRSVLTRALGVEAEVTVDELSVPVGPDDRILLCTDGLTSMLDEDEIARILLEHDDPQEAADALIEAANRAGGQDNITVVILDFEPEGGAAVEEAADAIKPGADDTAVISTSDVEARTRKADDTMMVPAPAAQPDRSEGTRSSSTALAGSIRRAGTGAPQARSRRGRRWILWTVAVVVVLASAGVGAKVFIDRQWYVGVHDGNVAIFRGIPANVGGVHLSTLEEETDIPASLAEKLDAYRDLPDGITADSEQDARDLVAQIRSDIQAAGP